jgi:hypothetical protein
MQNHLDCQQLLTARLKASWACGSIDRVKLSKTLRISSRQLLALESGQDDAFHTRGLYLRALAQALNEAGLKDDTEITECLACLSQHYTQTPRGSQIALVQKTVNKRLGFAPLEPGERPPARFGLLGAAMIVAVLVAVAIGVSSQTK